MLEDTPLTGDCNVLVVSFAQTRAGGGGSGSVSYRWTGEDGTLVDVREPVEVRRMDEGADPREWVRGVLKTVIERL